MDDRSPSFDDANGRPDGQRSNPRDSMLLQARMTKDSGEIVVLRVRNLSAQGLMADCAGMFVEGQTVGVELRGLGKVPGRIAWCRAAQIGVTFDREIDPLLARKPVGNMRNQPNRVHRPL